MQFSGHKAAFIGSATVDDNPSYQSCERQQCVKARGVRWAVLQGTGVRVVGGGDRHLYDASFPLSQLAGFVARKMQFVLLSDARQKIIEQRGFIFDVLNFIQPARHISRDKAIFISLQNCTRMILVNDVSFLTIHQRRSSIILFLSITKYTQVLLRP